MEYLLKIRYEKLVCNIILVLVIDVGSYVMHGNYTALFYNSQPYPIDIFWRNDDQKEVLYYKSNLAPGERYSQITHNTDKWIFKQAGTNNKLIAESNGVKNETFQGHPFGAQLNSSINVKIVGTGAVQLPKLDNFLGTIL